MRLRTRKPDSGTDTFNVVVTPTSAYANLALDGSTGNNTLLVFDQTKTATAQRNVSAGTFQILYPSGSSSLPRFWPAASERAPSNRAAAGRPIRLTREALFYAKDVFSLCSSLFDLLLLGFHLERIALDDAHD